jgi:hypothetical protein
MRSLSFVVCCLLAAPSAAEQPKLVMTALQCDPLELCAGAANRLRRDLQDSLEAAILAVVRGHLGVVTADALMRELTNNGQSRAEAEATCLNASCAVELGGAVGADYIVQSTVIQLGDMRKLTLKVWSVDSNTSASTGFARASSLAELQQRVPALAESVFARLVTRTRRQKSSIAGFDSSRSAAPQITSSAVTAVLGGLSAVGKPQSARVTLRSAQGKRIRLAIGDTRDRLALGVYQWTAEAEGYVPAAGKVTVRPDEITALIVALDKLGSLEILGTPKGASVSIDGPPGVPKTVGLGTALRGIRPGPYVLTIAKAGYERQRRELVVAPGGSQRVVFELQRLGGLKVSGSPLGAKVTVSGQPPLDFKHTGGLPWAAQGLASGMYRVDVMRQGYRSERKVVEVQAGEQALFAVELERDAEELAISTQRRRKKATSPVSLKTSNKSARYAGGGILAFGTLVGALNHLAVTSDAGANWSWQAAAFADVLSIGGLGLLLWGLM